MEADETYLGGLEKRKNQNKRIKADGGPVGKAIAAGVKDQYSNRISAEVVPDGNAFTLTGLIAGHVDEGTEVFADDVRGYLPL